MDNQRNIWERFLASLEIKAQSSEGTPEAEALRVFYRYAQTDSPVGFETRARGLLERYGKDHGSPEINESLLTEAGKWRDTTFPLQEKTEATRESPPPESFDWTKAIPKGGGKGSVGGGNVINKPTDDQLAQNSSFHEAQAIREFKKTLDGISWKDFNNPERVNEIIDRFYATNLSAEALLGKQYEMLEKHILADPKLKDNTSAQEALEKRKEEELSRFERMRSLPEDKLSEKERLERNSLLSEEVEAKRQLRNAIEMRRSKREGEFAEYTRSAFRSGWGRVNNTALIGIGEILPFEFDYSGFSSFIESEDRGMTTTTTQGETSSQEQYPQMPSHGRVPQGRGVKKAEHALGNIIKAPERELKNLAKQGGKQIAKTAAQTAADTAKNGIMDAIIGWLAGALGISVPELTLILVIAAIIIGIIIFLIVAAELIIFILIIFTTASPTSSQLVSPTSTAIPQGSCSGFACKGKLEALGVFTSGSQGLGGDPYGRDRLLYDTLSKILQPPSAYGTLLRLPKKTISVEFTNGGCTGHADHNGFLFLNGFGSCGTDIAQFMVTHELSHVIAFRNPSLYNKFLNTISYSRMKSLPTYNCQLDYPLYRGPFPGECFADGIGEYVTYKQYRDTVSGRPGYFTGRSFPNYRTQFSDFYNFAATYVFKGLTF